MPLRTLNRGRSALYGPTRRTRAVPRTDPLGTGDEARRAPYVANYGGVQKCHPGAGHPAAESAQCPDPGATAASVGQAGIAWQAPRPVPGIMRKLLFSLAFMGRPKQPKRPDNA